MVLIKGLAIFCILSITHSHCFGRTLVVGASANLNLISPEREHDSTHYKLYTHNDTQVGNYHQNDTTQTLVELVKDTPPKQQNDSFQEQEQQEEEDININFKNLKNTSSIINTTLYYSGVLGGKHNNNNNNIKSSMNRIIKRKRLVSRQINYNRFRQHRDKVKSKSRRQRSLVGMEKWIKIDNIRDLVHIAEVQKFPQKQSSLSSSSHFLGASNNKTFNDQENNNDNTDNIEVRKFPQQQKPSSSSKSSKTSWSSAHSSDADDNESNVWQDRIDNVEMRKFPHQKQSSSSSTPSNALNADGNQSDVHEYIIDNLEVHKFREQNRSPSKSSAKSKEKKKSINQQRRSSPSKTSWSSAHSSDADDNESNVWQGFKRCNDGRPVKEFETCKDKEIGSGDRDRNSGSSGNGGNGSSKQTEPPYPDTDNNNSNDNNNGGNNSNVAPEEKKTSDVWEVWDTRDFF